MDIARAFLGGLEDNRVDEAHERRIGDAIVDLELLGGVRHDLDRVQVECGATVERVAGALEALDLLQDVIAGRDSQFDLM